MSSGLVLELDDSFLAAPLESQGRLNLWMAIFGVHLSAPRELDARANSACPTLSSDGLAVSISSPSTLILLLLHLRVSRLPALASGLRRASSSMLCPVVLSHPIRSHLILAHLISSHLGPISSHLVLSHLMASQSRSMALLTATSLHLIS